MERILERYLREVDRLEDRKAELFERRNFVEKLLETLRYEERRIIELRYFKKYRWGMVAASMNYSERQCHNIHVSGMKKAVDSVVRLGLSL